MAKVTYEDPVILDSTGQAIVTQLSRLAGSQEYSSGDGIVVNNSTHTVSVNVGSNLSIGVDGKLNADAQSITVDDQLDGTSTNPVENSVLTAAFGGKADLADLATAFSDQTNYAVGDYVIYNGDLYRFTAAHTASSWDGSHATVVTVSDEIKGKQPQTLETPLTIGGTSRTTVETALGALNTTKSAVSVAHSGTASSTVVRKQQITIDSVEYEVDGSAYMEQSVTLSTSTTTTVTFTNAIIADGKMITMASPIWYLVPDDMVTTTGVCTITLPKWSTAETIGVRLYVR